MPRSMLNMPDKKQWAQTLVLGSRAEEEVFKGGLGFRGGTGDSSQAAESDETIPGSGAQ